jgi:ribokinase
MKKINQKVVCIGSMGKDIFFPVSSASVIKDDDNLIQNKQLCFGYGAKVHVEDRFTALGGCACNVSIGLSRLGIDVSALGNIGGDFDKDWIVSEMIREGVDVTSVQTIEKAKTDLSIIIVDTHTGERTIFVNRDVGEQLIINSDDIVEFDWCFVGSLYGNNIENNMRVVHDAITNSGMQLVYNPGGKNIDQDEEIVLDLIHHASLLFVNKEEAQKIVSKFDLLYNEKELQSEKYLMSILKKHMQAEVAKVVLTDGLRGAWGYDGQEIYHTNTIDKSVQDTTGAGDAFASGFFAATLHNLSMEQRMQWGSINGDSVVDYYGAQKGLKKRDTIEENTDKFPVENKK